MQQLRKLQKLIIGMGEALLCYGAEISRVEETIQITIRWKKWRCMSSPTDCL